MIWTVLGFSVAIVAAFCISVAECLVGKPYFEPFRAHAAIALGVLGAVAWFVGRVIGNRGGGERGFLLFDLRYWGPMLVVLGTITVFIRPLRWSKPERQAPVAKKVVVEPVVAIVKKEEPVAVPVKVQPAVFPNLKVQGLFYSDSKPVVILNGQSYAVGDRLGDVVVKAIDRSSVMLELQGEVKVLTLN